MSAMNSDGSQRELADVMKAAQQASSATDVGEEIAAFRRALGLTQPPVPAQQRVGRDSPMHPP
jgi:hypothetical protein